MRKGLIAAAMIVSAWALPAQAADVATLSCLVQEMPESARTVLIEAGRKIALQQAADDPADEKAQGDMAFALGTCVERHHWSRDTAVAATYYTIFDLMLRGTLIAGAPQGITEANVQAAIDRMPETARQQLAAGTGGYPELEKAYTAAGFKIRSGDEGELISAVAGAIAARAKYRAQFIAS